MLNKYFNNYGFAREQDVVEDLILESIKIYGHDVKYLPRSLVKNDHLFGEDTLSKFEEAIDIEMYLKSMEGFEGDGQFLSKFGLEIRDQIVLTVSRKRFDQVLTSPKLMTEVGYNLVFEDGDNNEPSRQFLTGDAATEAWVQEGDDYLNTLNRPREGDLIYFPMMDKIFEVMYVDDRPVHFQLGRMQSYDLRCELYEYSSEEINTGDSAIDATEDQFSLNTLIYQFTLEDGSGIVKSEDGDSILQEFELTTTAPAANNTFFQFEADSVLDFSESNPFSEVDRF
jgi:hypothetical protein